MSEIQPVPMLSGAPSSFLEEMRPGLTYESFMVPIRSLAPTHRERIASHLLSLSPRDRYLRFGYFAQDSQIRHYVESLDFDRDEIFGIYSRRLELLAVAHLAYSLGDEGRRVAEFGVSVVARARCRGYGARLFERASMHARNDGIDTLYIHALNENIAMLKIAQKAGALVKRDGTESDAYLYLPPPTLSSHIVEMAEEQFAQADYQLKAQAQQFDGFLDSVEELRKRLWDSKE